MIRSDGCVVNCYVQCDHCHETVLVDNKDAKSSSIQWLDQTIEMKYPVLMYEFHLCPKCRNDLLFTYFFPTDKKEHCAHDGR